MNIDAIMKELAEYTRMSEDINAHIEGLKDTLKQIMTEQNKDTLTGIEHKVTWKAVTSCRFDSTAFKAAHPDTYKEYSKPTTSKRFVFT